MQPSDTPAPIDPGADLPSPSGAVAGVLRLAPSLDLTRADGLHGELRSLAALGSAMVIDGSEVEIVSTACLQVLVAAAADAHRRGVMFRMQARSEILRQAVEDLGLVMYLRGELAG